MIGVISYGKKNIRRRQEMIYIIYTACVKPHRRLGSFVVGDIMKNLIARRVISRILRVCS